MTFFHIEDAGLRRELWAPLDKRHRAADPYDRPKGLASGPGKDHYRRTPSARAACLRRRPSRYHPAAARAERLRKPARPARYSRHSTRIHAAKPGDHSGNPARAYRRRRRRRSISPANSCRRAASKQRRCDRRAYCTMPKTAFSPCEIWLSPTGSWRSAARRRLPNSRATPELFNQLTYEQLELEKIRRDLQRQIAEL